MKLDPPHRSRRRPGPHRRRRRDQRPRTQASAAARKQHTAMVTFLLAEMRPRTQASAAARKQHAAMVTVCLAEMMPWAWVSHLHMPASATDAHCISGAHSAWNGDLEARNTSVAHGR